MGDESVSWKLKVKTPNFEIEAIGCNHEWVEKQFKELEARYLASFQEKKK
ncbi:MAG TPA: hypothetical protein VLU95_03390 [Candidatus Acidoferrum sp.]|nr:hypothetical protein [Candidatus Acidoferrum sp.]